MSKRLLDNLQEMKNNQGCNYVSFFNNGITRKDDYNLEKDIRWVDYSDSYYGVTSTLCSAIEKSIGDNDFDTVNMEVMLGLIYETSELDENGQITAKSKPVKNVVRYYTGPITCLLDGEKANDYDYDRNIYRSQGVLKYNKFISGSRDDGFIVDAPRSFEQFKRAILSGEPFDINISAKFKTKEKSDVKQFVKQK
ncbi:MAG: hypothetical protein IJG97_01935 [Bacilli bacterium]|nr:hypothetical protein [Bacilli bacterium]